MIFFIFSAPHGYKCLGSLAFCCFLALCAHSQCPAWQEPSSPDLNPVYLPLPPALLHHFLAFLSDSSGICAFPIWEHSQKEKCFRTAAGGENNTQKRKILDDHLGVRVESSFYELPRTLQVEIKKTNACIKNNCTITDFCVGRKFSVMHVTWHYWSCSITLLYHLHSRLQDHSSLTSWKVRRKLSTNPQKTSHPTQWRHRKCFDGAEGMEGTGPRESLLLLSWLFF